ncbi:hypothetical protein SBV1_3630006 [Verrucomicrobia bacterium]|nr:hypothetical protein SBV1_3630006 [Verrucomicrobiota bacterium]
MILPPGIGKPSTPDLRVRLIGLFAFRRQLASAEAELRRDLARLAVRARPVPVGKANQRRIT